MHAPPAAEPHFGRAVSGRVAPVEDDLVPVGIAHERHVADARVERVHVELDALLLELAAGLGDVGDAQRESGLVRRERHPLLLGLPDPERHLAGAVLGTAGRVLLVLEPEEAIG